MTPEQGEHRAASHTGVRRGAARAFRGAAAEARHLHAVEADGEAASTPYIALLGLFLVVLLPAFVIMLGLAFGAYYLL